MSTKAEEVTLFRRSVPLVGWGLTLLDWEWLARRANTFTCADCGHILWFRPRR